ncbi:MAG: YgfZ/GcvT domain-containing protein [Steroidobacteraceae bacterium]
MAMTRFAELASHSAVVVSGRDARSFLQGQLSNDLLSIERHSGMLAACCNRQGRVLATMRLAVHGDDVLMVLSRPLVPALISRLSTYVLRADVRITDHSDRITVAGIMDASPDARWSQASAAAAGLAMMVASPRRILLAGSAAALGSALAALPSASTEDWDRATVLDGEPVIEPGTAALWLPQMLNLDLLGAVSFSKGCYVGQEIVARLHHLGQAKRRMMRYVGPAGAFLHAAQALFSGDTLAAQVVSASGDAAGTQCLAVVELDFCASLLGAKPGGSEFVPADLPYAIPAPE